MMSIHRNLTTVSCAAVLALALAACGSSSDDDSAMMPTMPVEPVEPVETVEPGPTPAEVTKAAGTKAKAIGKVMPYNAELAFDVGVDVTVTAKRTGPDIKVEGNDDFTHVMGPMYSLMYDADDEGGVVEEIVLVDHTITNPKRTSFAKEHPLNASMTWDSTRWTPTVMTTVAPTYWSRCPRSLCDHQRQAGQVG